MSTVPSDDESEILPIVRLWYEPDGGQVLRWGNANDLYVHGRVLELGPLDLEVLRVAAIANDGRALKPEDLYVAPARYRTREISVMSRDCKSRVVLKRLVKLTAHPPRGNLGSIIRVEWQSTDPIKLWWNRRPVAGEQLGRSLSPWRFVIASNGPQRIEVRDPRHRSRPLVVTVAKRLEQPARLRHSR